jgi:zinc/manganese transport system substrate-binding protein
VVASTNVYGQIAEEIGGDAVDVTSIITSSTQDPHAYEASAQDQLAINEADIIIQNGGGYDSFVESLIESSGSAAAVITVAEFSHDWPGAAHEHEEGDEHAEETEGADEHEGHDHIEGFNEHVWYDPHTMEHFAEDLADQLGELRPEDADAIDANLQEFLVGISELEDELAAIAADHTGEKVFATEPVPLYLVEAAGLVNVSPEGFTEAVEEEQDVPPVVMLESLDLLRAGDIRIVLVNTQTGGAETTQIEDEAESLGIPVAAFSETLPEGDTYLEWMTANFAQIASALA